MRATLIIFLAAIMYISCVCAANTIATDAQIDIVGEDIIFYISDSIGYSGKVTDVVYIGGQMFWTVDINQKLIHSVGVVKPLNGTMYINPQNIVSMEINSGQWEPTEI